MAEKKILVLGSFAWSLSFPRIMGVVNITPDSFSDGGKCLHPKDAVSRAWAFWQEGADIVDLGAESTRPGAKAIDAEEEQKRLLPVLEGLYDFPLPISVDTRHPQTMRLALEKGASMINDVEGFLAPDAVSSVAQSQAALCVMHAWPHGHEADAAAVTEDVLDFFRRRQDALENQGIQRQRLLFDPGFGFGKGLLGDWALLRQMDVLASWGPILVGLSRKRMFSIFCQDEGPLGREEASLWASLWALNQGALAVRVHHVSRIQKMLSLQKMLANA